MEVQLGEPWAEEGRILGASQWCDRVAGLNQGPPYCRLGRWGM